MALRCTDHLIQEHRIILRATFVLLAMADRAKENRMPDAEDIESLLNFFRRFADDHHQCKEETVLFPELRNTAAGKTKGPLGQMMFEHDQERSLVEGLENALRTKHAADFSYYGERLAEILGTHIYKENNILFDLVEKTITKEADSRLSQDMEKFDLSMHPGVYEGLTHEVTRLEWKYLGKAA
jgi:hemerythrin-like domain-containing protein